MHVQVKTRSRDAPAQKRGIVWFGDWGDGKGLACAGYTTLAHNPEISAAVDKLATLVGAMTIHLMQNGENGDTRIRNGLSDLVDLRPNRYMGRSQLVQWIVRTLYLDGNGNAIVLPKTADGLIDELIPIPAACTALYASEGWGYTVRVNGNVYAPADVLHFALNPDGFYPWQGTGYHFQLADVAHNLKQAAATEKGFLQSKWKPSIIVKVDALTDEFSSPEGRKRLLDSYVDTGEAGEPWLIPAEQFSVEQIKPLTLSDLAISDVVTMDKRTVASILDIPAFVLGVGAFQPAEWNNFIATRIMPLAQILQQELTEKLLLRKDWYFRFNPRSLYNYSLKELADIADAQYIRGIMTGNEVRDWLGLSPKDGLDDLVMLENYIPRDRLGDQKKLNGGDENA